MYGFERHQHPGRSPAYRDIAEGREVWDHPRVLRDELDLDRNIADVIILPPAAYRQRSHALHAADQPQVGKRVEADFGSLPDTQQLALRLVDIRFDLHARR